MAQSIASYFLAQELMCPQPEEVPLEVISGSIKSLGMMEALF